MTTSTRTAADAVSAADAHAVLKTALPHAVLLSPLDGATGVAPDTAITIQIVTTSDFSPDYTSTVITVNGDTVWTSSAPCNRWSGALANGVYALFPPQGFAYGTPITVHVAFTYFGSVGSFQKHDTVGVTDAHALNLQWVRTYNEAPAAVDIVSIVKNAFITKTDTVTAGDSAILNGLPYRTGLKNWVRADGPGVIRTNLTNPLSVVRWNDESGNATDWISLNNPVTEPDAHPLYEANVVNGLPVIRAQPIAGAWGYKQTPYFSGSQEAEVFIALKSNVASGHANGTPASGGNVTYAFSDNSYSLYPYSDDTIWDSWGIGARQTIVGHGAATRSMGILNMSIGGGAWIVRLNGTIICNISAIPAWTTDWFTLFCWRSFGAQFLGDIGEHAAFDHMLDAGSRSLVYNYFQRWM